MIRLIDIRLNAAHPELPLAEAVTYTGAPSTMLIRGVPGNCGRWCITSVYVAATFPDGSTSTRTAVQSANGVWVATLPATNTSGRTANGIRIMADGEDENGELVTGYVLGVADFAVASLGVAPAPEPGQTSWQMLYFDAVPGVLRKGDVTKIDGVLKLYNGTTWEAFDARAYAAAQVADAKAAAAQNDADHANAAIDTHAANTTIHVTAADKTAWNGKQDALTPQQLANIAAVPDKLDKSSGGIVTGPVLINSNNATVVGPLTLGFNVDPERVENALDIIRASNGDIYLRIRDTTLANMVQQKLPRTSGTYALLSDINTAIQQIAPAWVSGTSYAANKLCSYNGVVYQNTSGATIQSATTPDTSGSGWTAKPVSDLFLPLTGGTMTGALLINNAHNMLKLGQNATLEFDWESAPDDWILRIKPEDSAQTYTVKIPKVGGTLALTAGPNHTGNLAALDADGNPTDSLIPTASVATKASPATDGHVAVLNAEGGLVDGGKSPTDLSLYALTTTTIRSGAVTLDDRAINAVTVSSALASLTVNFPTATSGKVRDFGLRLTVASGVTTAPQIVLPQGVVCENADGEVPEIGADGAATILYFTETASGVFLVKGEVVTAIS